MLDDWKGGRVSVGCFSVWRGGGGEGAGQEPKIGIDREHHL